MNIKSPFETDGDFCSNCGAILKLNELYKNTVCAVCNNETTLKNIIGVKNTYEIKFTPLGYYSQAKEDKKKRTDAESVDAGQMDHERECSKCKHKGMMYTTMQLRSADEGQTIFYLCPQCSHREVENS